MVKRQVYILAKAIYFSKKIIRGKSGLSGVRYGTNCVPSRPNQCVNKIYR